MRANPLAQVGNERKAWSGAFLTALSSIILLQRFSPWVVKAFLFPFALIRRKFKQDFLKVTKHKLEQRNRGQIRTAYCKVIRFCSIKGLEYVLHHFPPACLFTCTKSPGFGISPDRRPKLSWSKIFTRRKFAQRRPFPGTTWWHLLRKPVRLQLCHH